MKRLKIIVPGSSANIGPGFDTLALALNLYCTLTFDLVEPHDKSTPLITLKGALTDALPADRSNLIYTVLSNLWSDSPKLLKRVRITIESEIPLGKGVGSSAAAIMGAVWAAYALTDVMPDKTTLLSKASELEGHPDNVAASLLGGLVVCARSHKRRAIVAQKLAWPEEWCPIVVVPNYGLSTKKARAVLPTTVAREDAVHNVQNVALLLAAVQNKDEDALQEALHDKLHEPYRQRLVPDLPAVRKAVADFPVIGTVLSGAGSSILVLVNQRHRDQTLEGLRIWCSHQPQPPSILSLKADQQGARAGYE